MTSGLATFPENILDVFETKFITIPGVSLIVKRNIRQADPNGTVALCVDEWIGLEEEQNPQGNFEPTLTQHNLAIVHMVKDGSKETGELNHRNVAKFIREMLYRDPAMQLALRSLLEVSDDATHRTRPLRWSVTGQKFASNEIDSMFVSISSTEVSFVTETVSV